MSIARVFIKNGMSVTFKSVLVSELAATRDHSQAKIHDLRNRARDGLILANGEIKNDPTRTVAELTTVCRLLLEISVEESTLRYTTQQLVMLES